MPTRPQIIAVQKAKRAVGLNDAQYRTLLRNVAGCESSKDLDNRSLEDVMAVLEDMGAQQHPAGPTYWRNKVRRRNAVGGERMVHKIHALARAIPHPPAGLCLRMSGRRTDQSEQLTPVEAYKVIEALKAIFDRRSKADRPPAEGPSNLAADADEVPF